MSGRICSYFDCEKSKRKYPTLRIFHFPVKDEERCNKWIVNAGNPDLLSMDVNKLKQNFICEDHFDEELKTGKYLPKQAIPKHFSDGRGQSPLLSNFPLVKKVYPSTSKCDQNINIEDTIHYITPEKKHISSSSSPSSSLKKRNQFIQSVIDIPETSKSSKRKLEYSPDDDTPRKKKLKKKIEEQKLKLKSAASTISQMKRKVKKNIVTEKYTPLRSINSLPALPQAIVRMQLCHKKNTPWLSDERNVAISMYYKSPGAYKFLRKKGLILPSLSTIKSWIGSYKSQPGVNKRLFKQIKLKASAMSEADKKCNLVFDEMALKQAYEYSKCFDIIDGVEDLGEFGRKPIPAKQALVFLIRGIYSTWKIPLCFFFTNSGIKSNDLKNIIIKLLDLLDESGLKPISFTCDQSTTNQKLFKILNITKDNPYFIHKERKYYGLFDAPHIMKSIRNNLLSATFLKYGDKQISYEDIKNTYLLDKKSETGRALTKLTDHHIYPNAFQKMSVRLATQLLSKSVAAAIKTAVRTGEITSTTALNTAEFVEVMNNAFDALNSRQFRTANPHCCAYKGNNDKVTQCLDETVHIMNKIIKIDRRNKETRPPCFDGLILTITSIKMIFEDSKKDDMKYLLTARFNQDVLENQFSIYRQRGGYNLNPTVRLFRAAFKLNSVINLMKPPKNSNCEEDDDTYITEFNVESDSSHAGTAACVTQPASTASTSSKSSNTSTSRASSSQSNSTSGEVTLEGCAVVYFAGYLLKKCLDKFKCRDCRIYYEGLENLDEDQEMLIMFKDYNISNVRSLKTPSDGLLKLTKYWMQYYKLYFKKFWFETKILKRIKTLLLKRTKANHPEFLSGNCENHMNYMLDLLLRTLTFKNCRSMTHDLKSKVSHKKLNKLSILQNQ